MLVVSSSRAMALPARRSLLALLAGSSFVLIALYLLAQRADFPLAHALLELQGGHWSLKQHWLLESLLHRGGRMLSMLAWLTGLVLLLVRWPQRARLRWHAPLARLLLTTLLCTIVVGVLKATTHMDCPWDLSAFDGTRPFISLLTPRPEILGSPKCFPAAHAATGFAWIGLYFFFAAVRPSWRWAGLAVGLLLGLSFGLAQQLRGAHFLSHDIASLTLCWWVACAVELLARPSERSAA